VTSQPKDATPERSAGRIIARNTIFGVGAQVALRLAGFIFTILVVRSLGDENFGQYSIIIAWAGLFSVIGDLGINQYLAREIARDKTAAVDLFWDTVALRFLLAIIASAVTVGGAIALTDYSSDIVLGIAIFTSTYFLQSIIEPLQSLLIGNERVDVLSVTNFISQVAFMLMAGLFLYLGLDFVWLVVASAIALPITGIIQYRIIRRNNLGPPRLRMNRAKWLSLIRGGIPFAATQVSLSFAYQVDTIFLSQYTNDEVVGWYSAAYRLILAIYTLSRAFNEALLPTLSREHTSNPTAVRNWYFTSTRFIVLSGLPIVVGGALLSQDIIAVFGSEFGPAALALAILIWDIPFVMFHGFGGIIASSIKRENNAARIFVTIGVLNVVLNALLVPQFGLVAACFATVLTDLTGALLFYFLFRRAFGPGLRFGRIVRIILSAVLMGVVVWLLQDVNIFIVIPVAGITYLTLIWISGALLDEERTQIVRLLRRGLNLVLRQA
jgi:O-antigen/teichoic acid export membrane protein